MSIGKPAAAEFIGTFWLVFGGTGHRRPGRLRGDGCLGWVGVALAFGLTVVRRPTPWATSPAPFQSRLTIGL